MGTRRLADVSEHTTITLFRLLNWPGAICRSSSIPAREGRSERLADLAQAVGASTYLCGTGGSRYLDPAPFASLGRTVGMFTRRSTQLTIPLRMPVVYQSWQIWPWQDPNGSLPPCVSMRGFRDRARAELAKGRISAREPTGA